MIKTLLTTLKQDKETFEVPKSVQDAIPIRRLWPDGIFQFGSKFSKTLRFSDINYAMQSDAAKQNILTQLGTVYAGIPADCWMQVCIVSQRICGSKLCNLIFLQ